MIFILHTSCQKLDVIWESLSVMMLHGVLKQHSMCSKKSSVKLAAIVSSQVGMNSAYFVTWHTIVSMLLCSWPFLIDSGRPMIQSRLISLNGEFQVSVGIGRGSNWP